MSNTNITCELHRNVGETVDARFVWSPTPDQNIPVCRTCAMDVNDRGEAVELR